MVAIGRTLTGGSSLIMILSAGHWHTNRERINYRKRCFRRWTMHTSSEGAIVDLGILGQQINW
jgi:hypothetical protein